MVEVCNHMARLVLTEDGCKDAYHGRPIDESHVECGTLSRSEHELFYLLDGRQKPIAIGKYCSGHIQVVRGFRYESSK